MKLNLARLCVLEDGRDIINATNAQQNQVLALGTQEPEYQGVFVE